MAILVEQIQLVFPFYYYNYILNNFLKIFQLFGVTFTGTLYYDDVQIFIDNVTVVNTSVNSERNQLNITPENFVQNKFVAYPNPFTNNITILHSVAGANDIVNIYSLQGALIGSQKIVPNSSQSYFNTSKLAKGQYVIKYIGAVQQQTILVNKF